MQAYQCARRTLRAHNRLCAPRCVSTRAAAPAPAAVPPPPPPAAAPTKAFSVVCPICQTTKLSIQKQGRASTSSLHCDRCNRRFASTSKYVDLTLTSGIDESSYKQNNWGGVETFRRPAVSVAYERGWRQGFAWAGFPGADEEYQYAMEYLRPQYGRTLVDMSCGSGLFTRRFAKSGKFDGVIASDFSESMLSQTYDFIEQDSAIDATSVLLLRADVGRLPFATGSVAAVHAGAAIHCWPNPTAALAEISRVLAPGGVFVGSTFLDGTAPLGELIGNDALVAPLKAFDPTQRVVSSQYRWWSEPELRDLCASVGLEGFERQRRMRFILWSVRKPQGSGDAAQAPL